MPAASVHLVNLQMVRLFESTDRTRTISSDIWEHLMGCVSPACLFLFRLCVFFTKDQGMGVLHPNRCFILRTPLHTSGFSRLMKYSKASIRDRKGSDQVKSSWTFSSDILLVQRCKVVIGGGDTAVDCVGTSIRFSAYILRFVFLYDCTAQESFEWFGAGGSRIWWHWIITCWGRRSVPPSAPPRYYLRLLSLLWLFWSYLFFDPPNWFYDPQFFKRKSPNPGTIWDCWRTPQAHQKIGLNRFPTSFE